MTALSSGGLLSPVVCNVSTISARTHNTTIKAIKNRQAWSGHRTIWCLPKSGSGFLKNFIDWVVIEVKDGELFSLWYT